MDHQNVLHKQLKKDHDIGLRDLGLKVEQTERAHHTLHVELSVSKLFTRWVVARPLNADQKTRICNHDLKYFNINTVDFLRSRGIVAILRQRDPRAVKVMATNFWDSIEILLIDNPEESQIINGTYYTALLTKANSYRNKARHEQKKLLFNHDNAQLHTSRIIREKIDSGIVARFQT